MDDLLAQADKLQREVEFLAHQVESLVSDPSNQAASLAASQGKRVRRESTILLRELSQLRDNLQPEGTR